MNKLRKFLPLIIKGIIMAEATMTNGEGKKAHVLDLVKIGAELAGESGNDAVAAAGSLIDSIVSTLNEHGVLDGKLKKKE